MKSITYLKTDVTPDKIIVVTIDCPGKVNKVSSALLDEIN